MWQFIRAHYSKISAWSASDVCTDVRNAYISKRDFAPAGPVGKALVSFSLPKNWNKLFSEDVVLPGVIVALDGVRVFSTLWVIMTHKILFFAQEPWLNKGDILEVSKFSLVWYGNFYPVVIFRLSQILPKCL
jgi:hypothetical protein